MKRMNWWWVALASAVGISAPAAITLAQPPAADDETLEATADELAWFEPADDDVMWQDEGGGGGGGEMGRHFEMRRGPDGGHGSGMGGGMGPGGPGADFAMRLHALDLTDDQRTKIEAIHERAQRKNIQARADLQIAQLDMHKLLRAANPDRRAIEAQIDKVSAMQAAMHKARVGAMFEARAVLTDAQRKKLQEMRREWPQMRGQHRRYGGAEESPRPESPHGSH